MVSIAIVYDFDGTITKRESLPNSSIL